MRVHRRAPVRALAATAGSGRRDFGASFVSTLTALGAADPNGLAHFLLPDILTYDTSSAVGFPNGASCRTI
jgi:hypothetical protein